MSHYSLKPKLLQLLSQLLHFPWVAFPIQVVQRYRTDRCTRHAAALSYSSLLALAPMVAIMFAMLSLFSSVEQLGNTLEDFIYSFLVPAAGDELKAYLDQFAGQAGKLSLIGLGFFLLTALLLLFNIEESFNDIWRVKKGRRLAHRVTVYWAMVSLGPLLMGASLSLSTYFLSLTVIEGVGFTKQVYSAGVAALPFLFEMLAFLLLYTVMPNVRVSFVHGLLGALVASCLFEITKRGFALYVVNFNSYEVVYGTLSTLPIFLVWIYLSWMVTLLGAEVVAVLQQNKLFEFDQKANQ